MSNKKLYALERMVLFPITLSYP